MLIYTTSPTIRQPLSCTNHLHASTYLVITSCPTYLPIYQPTSWPILYKKNCKGGLGVNRHPPWYPWWKSQIPFKLCPNITNIPSLRWPLRGCTQKGEGTNYQLGCWFTLAAKVNPKHQLWLGFRVVGWTLDGWCMRAHTQSCLKSGRIQINLFNIIIIIIIN
jgi:hypothetical protein